VQTYAAAVINSALAASKFHLGLFNGATSNRLIKIWRVDVVNHLTAANTGTATSFLLNRTTAAGTGSAAGIRKHDNKSITLPSAITALHTYSPNPTLATNPEMAELTVYTEETTGQSAKMPLFQAAPECGITPITLRAGEGIVVQQSALASAGAVSVFIYFTMEKTYAIRN
jgi:hypothetical protein